ncbi:hypothetical protein M4I32_07890 [Microbacterium sp. LRZ72]|uniref:hypothetical protein n=1 Tax=Microbacterium sp. LRZ72 TaxID=2942481 RepID=UPI0029A878E8|nr:hypothetical protein [Microbacterium sp. LRZ72]MDX2376719.1 hypothetical protein [Microbacterium sp. LRZ72]
MTDDLPPIEDWWPDLTIGARHELLREPTAELTPRTRQEIQTATGAEVGSDARLADDDVTYVHTQTEQVD